MADLLDIAPATAAESVKIAGGQRLVVKGLHGNAIASIAARFPKLIASFAAHGDNVVMLISSFGVAVGPIIAAGCGHLGDEKAEAIANGLLIEDQIQLLKAIFGLTFPNGLSSFMTLMTKLMTEPAENQIRARVRLKKSPSASPPSSAADFPQTMQ